MALPNPQQSRINDLLTASVKANIPSYNDNKIKLDTLDLSDLGGAVFKGHDLGAVNFLRAKLNAADFSYCRLANSCFVASNLDNTDFTHSRLDRVDFEGATLTNAIFEGACFSGFSRFSLDDKTVLSANFKNASGLDQTVFSYRNKTVIGLTVDSETGQLKALPKPHLKTNAANFQGRFNEFVDYNEDHIAAANLVGELEGLEFAEFVPAHSFGLVLKP